MLWVLKKNRLSETILFEYPQHRIWLSNKRNIVGKRPVHFLSLNPFPHTTILQQTTLYVFYQNIENLHNWMDNLWQKVENIVAKGQIARFVQFPLLSLCFQKAVCCRGVRKRLFEGKGLKLFLCTVICYRLVVSVKGLTLSLIQEICSRRLWTYFV